MLKAWLLDRFYPILIDSHRQGGILYQNKKAIVFHKERAVYLSLSIDPLTGFYCVIQQIRQKHNKGIRLCFYR